MTRLGFGNRIVQTFLLVPSLFITSVCTDANSSESSQTEEGTFAFETMRSPVSGLRGVVSTSQPLAANAGLDILKQGGNAIDAAVATAAVLTVVEPMSTSLGGDAFIMIYLAEEDRLVGINASGRAASAVNLEKLNEKLEKHEMDRIGGIYSVTVPGAVDGWFEVLEEYGTMSMAEVLEPAIHYAENGFPVSEIIADAWESLEDSEEPSTRETWLIDGERSPRMGEVFVNKDLARTFRLLATEGRDVFYKGEIAEAIVNYSDEHDGFLSMEDFAEHTSTWVEPIHADYKNYRLYELPPNGQGIAALEMLKILENTDMGAMEHNSAEYLHYIIEAKKLAFEDRAHFYADPDFSTAPVSQLISKSYAKSRVALINTSKASKTLPYGEPEALNQGDTVYLTVADGEGNMLSLIQSNYRGIFPCFLESPFSALVSSTRRA